MLKQAVILGIAACALLMLPMASAAAASTMGPSQWTCQGTKAAGYACSYEGINEDNEFCMVEWTSGTANSSWEDDDDEILYIECISPSDIVET